MRLFRAICMSIALALFLVAAIAPSTSRVNFIGLGLAVWIFAELVPLLSA